MKVVLKYIFDSAGKTKSVQLSIKGWEKLMTRLRKYEQTVKIKSGLKEAFKEVAQLRKSKEEKQTGLKAGHTGIFRKKFEKELWPLLVDLIEK